MSDEDDRDPLEQLDGPAEGGEPNATPTAYKRRLSKIEQAEADVSEFWRSVMADPAGRRAIWGFIAETCHAFETKFPCGPTGVPQPEATWFHAGKQAVGFDLYNEISARCPQETLKMRGENDTYFKQINKRRRGVKNDD